MTVSRIPGRKRIEDSPPSSPYEKQKKMEDSPPSTPPEKRKRQRPPTPYPQECLTYQKLLESVSYLAPTDPRIAPIQERAKAALEDSSAEMAEELTEEISDLTSLTLQFQNVEGIPACVQELYSRIVAVRF